MTQRLFVVVLLWLGPTVAAAQTKPAVIPTQFDETAQGMVPALLDDYLLTAVQNVGGGYQVIGKDDISADTACDADGECTWDPSSATCVPECYSRCTQSGCEGNNVPCVWADGSCIYCEDHDQSTCPTSRCYWDGSGCAPQG